MLHGELRVDVIRCPEAHVIERQKVEIEGSGVIDLIVGVIVLDAESAVELAEIYSQAASDRKDIRAVRLEQIPVNLRPGLVLGSALERLRILPEHEIDAAAVSAARLDVRSTFQDEPELVQREVVGQHVIGTKQVDAADGPVEVITVVTVEIEVQRCACGKSQNGCTFHRFGLRGSRFGRRRRLSRGRAQWRRRKLAFERRDALLEAFDALDQGALPLGQRRLLGRRRGLCRRQARKIQEQTSAPRECSTEVIRHDL